jgi:hypothetical protein
MGENFPQKISHKKGRKIPKIVAKKKGENLPKLLPRKREKISQNCYQGKGRNFPTLIYSI